MKPFSSKAKETHCPTCKFLANLSYEISKTLDKSFAVFKLKIREQQTRKDTHTHTHTHAHTHTHIHTQSFLWWRDTPATFSYQFPYFSNILLEYLNLLLSLS